MSSWEKDGFTLSTDKQYLGQQCDSPFFEC